MTRHTSHNQEVNVQPGKVDAFGERVEIAIEMAGGTTKMAEMAGVSTSVLSKWRRGESDPSRSRLVKMARAAGVSVEWLATGEGGPDQGATAPTELGKPDIDLDTLEEVAVKVLALLEQRRPDLSTKARARIVRLVYEFYIKQEKPMDEASLNNVIELAAFR
jgi:transcriptional regulator with XRE-family HTH domain